MIKKIPNFALGILFILFYTMAWTPTSQAYLVSIAFVPIFILVDRFIEQNTTSKKVFFSLFSIYFLSGLILNFWISNAHWAGTVLATVVQTFLLLIPTLFHYRFSKKGYPKQGFLIFLLSTITLEYAQNFWDLSWPWFNLGHSLSVYPSLIQWYQYTGAIGGTLWLIFINIFIYNLFYSRFNKTTKVIFSIIFITPLFFTVTHTKPEIKYNSLKVLIHQPNLDAYREKFNTNLTDQIQNLIPELQKLDPSETTLILCPETFIYRSIEETHVETNPYINLLQSALVSPNHYIVTGANSRRVVNPDQEKDKGSIRERNGVYYKVFNSAVLFNKNKTIDIYNKSKLVAGAETTPFSSVLTPLLGSLFNIDLGGVSGNLGKSDAPKILKTDEFAFSPIICFESAFGDYTAEFSELGADFIAIITNDDWWDDTSGHKHHFELAKIRAIENQKYVVRSANTGISGIIGPDGEVIESLGYRQTGNITGSIILNPENSYYSINKHLIGKLCTFVLAMLLLQMETLFIRTKKNA